MADLVDVAGAQIFIGGALGTKSTDFAATDFSTQVWSAIDGWQKMGPVGDTRNVITTSLINRDRDIYLNGTKAGATMQNEFAFVHGDAGQAALKAALATKSNYAIKIQFDDAITPSTGTPTILYFIALVTSVQDDGGNANTVRMLKSDFRINSNVVEVAAT